MSRMPPELLIEDYACFLVRLRASGKWRPIVTQYGAY